MNRGSDPRGTEIPKMARPETIRAALATERGKKFRVYKDYGGGNGEISYLQESSARCQAKLVRLLGYDPDESQLIV